MHKDSLLGIIEPSLGMKNYAINGSNLGGKQQDLIFSYFCD